MDISFSEWLIFEMNARGMTQSDLARASSLTRGGISNLINQVRKPDADTVNAIARAFKLPPETVFRAAGLLPPAPPSSERLERLTYLLSMLDDDDLQDLEDLAKAKADRKTSKTKKSRSAARSV